MELKVRIWDRKCAAVWMVLESGSLLLRFMKIPNSLPWERLASQVGWFGHSDKDNIEVTGQPLYQPIFGFVSLICAPSTDPADCTAGETKGLDYASQSGTAV